jgi:hypothetical protein
MATLLRIYCAWNNRIDEKRFDLGCPGSRNDIERQAGELRDGMRVLLYEPDELDAEGTIEFDPTTARWVAIPDWSTMRYIGSIA